MDRLRITGGRQLAGEILVSGAKNAALPILCACLLAADTLELSRVPSLQDVRTMLRLLRQLGVRDGRDGDTLTLDARELSSHEAPYDLVKTMRASILVLGPLLARLGQARVSLPGGCAIGARPVDQHIKGLRAMGAHISIEHGYVVARAARLKGARIVTDMVTVTGTENLMMAATLARGTTLIENAAREPEVVDLARVLSAMGARISGAGSDRIEIEGVESLHGARHAVMADRIEAGTFLCAVAATGGDITLRGIESLALDATLEKLRATGASIETGADWVRLVARDRPQAVSVRTAPFPGFATDMQAQFMAVDAIATGTATITETIFENRFMHVLEMQRLGADIRADGHHAVVRGVAQLSGAPVKATDIRAGAALVVAGLAAEGETAVSGVHHVDRGYDDLVGRLVAVGADIERIG